MELFPFQLLFFLSLKYPEYYHRQPRKTYFANKPHLILRSNTPLFRHLLTPKVTIDNGVGAAVGALGSAAIVVEPKVELEVPKPVESSLEKVESSLGGNGSVPKTPKVELVSKFENPRWVNGSSDLTQFQKDDKIDWEAVIDAGEVF